MSSSVPLSVANTVASRAGYRCEYCQTSFYLVGQTFHIDHIIPTSKGGRSDPSNLCYACPNCNGAKSNRTDAVDEETQTVVPLFDPRQHDWQNHFRWREDGTHLIGRTAIGRVTIVALRMNRPSMIRLRQLWVIWEEHPP